MLRWIRARRAKRLTHDFGRVAPWLLVGPVLERSGYAELAEHGVTHILDLRSENSDDLETMRALDFAWRRVPIEDRAAPTSEQLAEINAWLDHTAEQPVLYVHCEGGLGRSPTVAIALLMQRGFTRVEAHRFMLAARPMASPTPEQDAWLTTLEDELEALADKDKPG